MRQPLPSPSSLAFGLLALVLYLVLVMPWPGLIEGYSALFRKLATAAYADLFAEARIRLDPIDEPTGTVNTQLVLIRRSNRAFVQRKITPWRLGYLPTALAVALCLAVPIAARRRLIVLAGGFVAVHLFVALRILLLVANGLNEPTPAATLTLGPTASRILANASLVLAETVTVGFVVPVLIWIMVTIAVGCWPFERVST